MLILVSLVLLSSGLLMVRVLLCFLVLGLLLCPRLSSDAYGVRGCPSPVVERAVEDFLVWFCLVEGLLVLNLVAPWVRGSLGMQAPGLALHSFVATVVVDAWALVLKNSGSFMDSHSNGLKAELQVSV
ncbi:hypothetical protein U1Q18_037656 [Sarracenia purpurea var. burkii]